ncbi:HD domain-containing protein [Mycoplasmatota bacterium]|nr:HD domain-containing protein [Mycoplasmatota bacterium]
MWDNIVEIFRKNRELIKKNLMIYSYFLTLMIAFLVYFLGGTSKVYTNLMYIPIAIIATSNGKKYAVINAVISGIILGPIMPLDVKSNTMQAPMNWIIRLIIYIIIAFVMGYIADHYKKEYEKNIEEEKELAEVQRATIFALVKLSEARDEYTGLHVERVAVLCKYLTSELRKIPKYKDYIDDEYIENIYKASPLHDIGKINMPDRILLKPGKLTPEEFEVIKTHTRIGANTLLEFKKAYPHNKILEFAISIACYHHEKWDGTGYTHGLAGEDIPLSARVMAIIDVYDALRSKRVYKEAYSHEKSIEIIKQGKGTHFDPIIIDTLLQSEIEFKKIYDRITEKKVVIDSVFYNTFSRE